MSSDRNLASDAEAETRQQPPARRDLSDPRAMRAMTHPVRLALLEALSLEGPLTATQAGELIGEPPNTCSFHFRQLAKYGFVEEAGPAPGRSRPWRLVSSGMRYTDLHEDPATVIAARELDTMLRERHLARLDAFYAARSSMPREWQEVTGGSQAQLYLTPAELRQVDEEITAILDRYLDRLTDPERRPEGSAPIEILLFAYPFRQPGR